MLFVYFNEIFAYPDASTDKTERTRSQHSVKSKQIV